MATLADELLNDFEESGSEAEEETTHDFSKSDEHDAVNGSNGASKSAAEELGMDVDGDEDEDAHDEELADGASPGKPGAEAEDEEETKARVEKMQLGGVNDVRNVAGLMKTLGPLMEKIAYYQQLPPEQQSKNVGSVEEDPEYKLLTQANALSTQIDSEIILVHKFIRDHYSVRFPELETLVTNPLNYAKTVAIIKNGPMDQIQKIGQSTDNIVGQTLRQVLDGPSIMVVTVEATNARGRALTDAELQTVLRACEMTLSLDRAKETITTYVQSRMTLFAPNMTALIGSLTAAQLLNFAGGLTGLAKTPACNIAPLGSRKQTSGMGFATNVGIRHQGFLYHSPIIQQIPSDLRKQALRIVAAKVILAARVDMAHQSPDGSLGQHLSDDCLKRLDKLTEPPPNKGPRALPAPDDKPSRKRGGRRARKAKEAVAMTDLRKAQNRMAFGKEEAEVGFGDSTKGLGMMGMDNKGRIRAEAVDQRTRAKLSKKNAHLGIPGTATSQSNGLSSSLRGFGQGAGAGSATTLNKHGLRTSGVGGSGTASTVNFGPVQGLELIDPKVREEQARKRAAEEDRWFKSGSFTQVGGGTPAKKDSEGFAVPGLPSKKQKTDGS